MDMRKYSGEHFVKVDDVRDGPIEGRIVTVKQGKWDKPNIVLESGDVLSLNATNNQILMRAYGAESDHWSGKIIRLFLGEIEYQGSPREAVLVEPVSPPNNHEAAKAAAARDQTKPKADYDDSIPF